MLWEVNSDNTGPCLLTDCNIGRTLLSSMKLNNQNGTIKHKTKQKSYGVLWYRGIVLFLWY